MSNLPPPGFYPDASDNSLERWWNGQGWSDTTRPRATGYSTDPTESAVAETEAPQRHPENTTTPTAPSAPANGWLRFLARRSSNQVILVAVLTILLGPAIAIMLSLVGVFISGLSILIMLTGLGLLGYGLLLHDEVRRRYGP